MWDINLFLYHKMYGLFFHFTEFTKFTFLFYFTDWIYFEGKFWGNIHTVQWVTWMFGLHSITCRHGPAWWHKRKVPGYVGHREVGCVKGALLTTVNWPDLKELSDWIEFIGHRMSLLIGQSLPDVDGVVAGWMNFVTFKVLLLITNYVSP